MKTPGNVVRRWSYGLGALPAIGLFVAASLGVAVAKDDPRFAEPILIRNLDVSQYFKVSWQSVQRSATISNPAAENAAQPGVQRRLYVNARVHLLTTKNLIGVSPRANLSRLTDDGGKELKTPPDTLRGPRHYQPWSLDTKFGPDGQRETEPRPYPLMVDIDVNALGELPSKLSRVEGHFHALFATSCEEVDVPFRESKEWVELEPGLSIRITEAVSENRQYRYRIDNRDDREHHLRFTGFLDEHRELPERILVEQQLLDSRKEPIHPRRHSFFGTPGGSGSGGGDDKYGDVKTIRFVYAIKPYERKVPFVLEDIPVPEP
jgi:hypothetical protein